MLRADDQWVLTLGDEYESWDLTIAVEGPDDGCFYYDFVRDILGDRRPMIFEGGGKERLLQFRTSAEGYNWKIKPQIFYLCDKDFDDILGIDQDGVFKTNTYCIESFFIGPEFIEYIIEKYSKRALSDLEREEFLTVFCSKFLSLMPTLRVISAAMCEIRFRGTHPQFDNFGIEKIFSIRGGQMKRKGGVLTKMWGTLDLDRPPSHAAILCRAQAFDLREYKGWLRGKLGLQATRKIYECSRDSMPKAVKDKLPESNYIGSEAFKTAKPFLGEVPGLSKYILL